MTLLLAFLIIMVLLGLVTEHLTPRIYLLIFGIAIATTVLYYVPQRFMK